MQFKLSQYEFKDSNSDDWQEISEIIVLGKLADEIRSANPFAIRNVTGQRNHYR